MDTAEHEPDRESSPNEQVLHLPEAAFVPEAERHGWLHLADLLIATYQGCLMCVQPHLETAMRTRAIEATVESALQGHSAALALIESPTESILDSRTLQQEHPWAEIGRAYAAAFTAAGVVALQAPERSPRISALAPELARLALRAAETLAHGIGLLLGTRQSGSLAQVCAYIGSLENKTDTLLRSFLAAPAPPGGNDARQGNLQRYTTDRQILKALEAMTDRCEDIGDALLAIPYRMWEERALASNAQEGVNA